MNNRRAEKAKAGILERLTFIGFGAVSVADLGLRQVGIELAISCNVNMFVHICVRIFCASPKSSWYPVFYLYDGLL